MKYKNKQSNIGDTLIFVFGLIVAGSFLIIMLSASYSIKKTVEKYQQRMPPINYQAKL